MMRLRCLVLCVILVAPAAVEGQWQPSGLLEIHYINVGQGSSVLIIGPDGTRILYDFGRVSGDRDIVPYLRDQVRLPPELGLHFTMVSHRDTDHYVGFKDVIEAGYDVLVANYGPGSPKTSSTIRRQWLTPADATTAGPVRAIPVGLPIALGDGAEAIVMAANGRVYQDPTPVDVENENDRSISLFVRYRDFEYILDGDLGGGPEACSGHETNQVDVQNRVALSLINLGLIDSLGIDVIHVAHHGSESSTPASYFEKMRPEVGLISVGVRQGTFLHPRVDVVDSILLRPPTSTICGITAPPLVALLQTEDGKSGSSSTGSTSFAGVTIGDIKLVTNGRSTYTITGSNRVHEGEVEAPELFSRSFAIDETGTGGNGPGD